MRLTPPPGFDAEKFLKVAYWHQAWEIFPGIRTPGPSSVETIAQCVGLPEDLTGKRVLDIGAWNGCASFECERRGAREVVALTLEDPNAGFNQLKDLLKSERTGFLRGSIYNLDPNELGKFDIVLCFGVVYHLRYPVLGIDNLRRVATGELYVESHLLDHCLIDPCGEAPRELVSLDHRLERMSLLQFHKSDQLNSDPSNWFSPSASALTGLLESAGFIVDLVRKSADRGYFRCHAKPGLPPFLQGSYEGVAYKECGLERMLGPVEQWHDLG